MAHGDGSPRLSAMTGKAKRLDLGVRLRYA